MTFKSTHLKERRIFINLHYKVVDEIKRLEKFEQVCKLKKCSEQQFFSPIILAVKKGKSIKLALNLKQLNKAIDKNKNQISQIENLFDAMGQVIR